MDEETRVRIFVLDRGHVKVARSVEPQQHCLWLPVTDSRTVRRWGTTGGLAELCDGPTAETVLDNLCPAESIPVRAILTVMEVTDKGVEAWERHLSRARPAVSTGTRSARR